MLAKTNSYKLHVKALEIDFLAILSPTPSRKLRGPSSRYNRFPATQKFWYKFGRNCILVRMTSNGLVNNVAPNPAANPLVKLIVSDVNGVILLSLPLSLTSSGVGEGGRKSVDNCALDDS